MCFKMESYSVLGDYPLGESAYPFDCTFFRLICLTAKARKLGVRLDLLYWIYCTLLRVKHNKPSLTPNFRRFLVGATEPEKGTLKRVQLRILG